MKALRFFIIILTLVANGQSVYSQNGPFGIGNTDGAEAPTGYDQPKLLLWLDGSDVNTSSGFVTQWNDKSGNGHHFVPPTAGNRPVLQSSSGPSNTPVLSFDGVDDRLVCSNMEMTGNGFSVYCVFRTSDDFFGFYSYGNSSNPDTILIYNNNGIAQRMGSAERNSPIGNESNGGWEYFGMWWNRDDNRLWEYEEDGTYENNNSFANGFLYNSSGEAVIGDIPLAGGGYETDGAFDGEIAELIIWEGHMTRPIARMMRTYIWTKYGQNSNNLFREGNSGWDKFQAYSSGSGGKYYHSIAVGRDAGGNPGEHCESRLEGLILRVNKDPSSEWDGGRRYLCAGWVPDAGNSIVATNLPTGVEARWSRVWEIGSRDDGNQRFRIGFDFGEGIGGEIPQVADNFVLLRRIGNSGTFSIVPESQYLERSIVDDEVVFRLIGSNIDDNNRFYTIGTKNAAISSLDGSNLRTWYAYQTGNWSNPTTWTLDGSAAPSYVNPGGNIPASGDNVVIGAGRAVTIDIGSISQSNLSVNGTLDVGTAPQPSFTSISGSGLIRCAGNGGNSNFPLGSTTSFADPVIGGRVEFYGSGGLQQSSDLEVNEMEINFNASGQTLTLTADFISNGTFEVTRGTFTINNTSDVSRTLSSYGNVVVSNQGRIKVSSQTGNRSHTWSFYGNLINDGGEIKFTNRTAPSASNYDNNESQHWVIARFVNGTENQSLIANGESFFSRIVVNKGNDMTYILTISSSNPNYFKLLGRCTAPGDSPFVPESNWSNSCLALVNGTIEIRENIFIPLDASGGNYTINETAMLWVNGGSAAKGAPQVIGGNNTQAIVPYGIIKVSAGALYANCRSGITTRANGLIQLDDGYIFANQIRTSVLGTENIGGVIINGGLMEVNGTAPGGTAGEYYTFSLTYPGNLFRMTGGELRVKGPTGRGLIFINSDPEQTNVSGGTVVAEVINTSSNHKITSRAPFWNLEIQRTSTSSTNRAVRVDGGSSGNGSELASIAAQDLFIKNRLTIRGANAAILDMNDLDLYLDGDFIIENGGVYSHGLNTTYLTGNNNSFLSLNTSSTTTFNNLVVDKDADTRFAEIQSGNSTRAMEIQGTFSVERGYFENNDKNVSLLGNTILKSTFGSSSSTGTAFIEGVSSQEIISASGVFHNLELNNPAGVSLENGDLVVRKRMKIEDGVFDLLSHKLRVEAPDGFIDVTNPGATKCFATNGQSSAGGLEVAFTSGSQQTTYPIGARTALGVDYTPAIIRVNSGFVDTGYVRIAPVDTLLLTTDITAANHYLNYYWKVNHSEFQNLPNVSHRFEYLQADVEGIEDSLASGRVLFESPFLRSVDSTSVFDDNVDVGSNFIYHNGPNEEATLTGVGTQLVNADYTAAHIDRFVGGPEVYYSISTAIGASWNVSNNWTNASACPTCMDPEDFHGSGAPASDYPKAGDIVFIGYVPSTKQPHVYSVPVSGVEASQVNFTQMKDGSGNPIARYYQTGASNLTLLRPTLTASTTTSIEKIGEINGEGALKLTADVNLSSVNTDNFLAQDSSIIIIESSLAVLDFTSFPSNIPNLFITSNNNGFNDRSTSIRNDVTIRGNLEIIGNANLLLNDGASGDISVGNNLIIAKYQANTAGAELRFNNGGAARTVDVRGNIQIKDNSTIRVGTPTSTPQLVHNLVAWNDIIQNTSGTGLNLFTDLADDYITLTLRGEGNHSFQNISGNTPMLGKLIVDKGIDINSSFSFNSDVDIEGPSDQAVKSIELLNGLLELNDSGIGITLSSGGGDFRIPNTAGLELSAGDLLINGNETGLLLDGLLKLNGGSFNIGNTPGQNNYLEYSSNGTAQLEINGGILNVGSQIRRGLTNISGVLKFIQTGGEVNLAVYSAPNANRGVLEILNSGSLFEHTGGVINFYRGINSSSISSFRLEPDNFTVGSGSSIVIGHANSPSDGAIQNFGIQSAIALNALEINNDSGHDPTVRVQVFDLELNDLLEIDGGSQLNCANRNLILNSDITNNGLLNSSSGLVTLNHSVAGNVDGDGVYQLFNLDRVGGGLTNVDANLVINNDFSLDDGDMDFGTNTLTVKGNSIIDGHVIFSTGSNGLILNGSGSQILRRTGPGTSQIDAMYIDNPSGVDMINGADYQFIMDKDLQLANGILNLRGNLLELGINSEVIPVNAFDNNNMISTGGAFTNFGVRKFIPSNSTDDYLIPLGIDVYMPIRLDFSESGFSSGNLESNYLFKLNIPQHPVIVNDTETPGPQINDFQNVLGMYFSMDASDIGAGLQMRAVFQYSDDYVNVSGLNPDLDPNVEADYIGAQVVDDGSPSPPIIKINDAVDEANNTITFEYNGVTEEVIDGDYFAGIDNAIPDFVPFYETVRNGNVDEGSASGVYNTATLGEGIPNGSIVRINDPHTLNFNVDGVNLYKTIIEEGAVLQIDETSFHRLGIVEGEGIIRLIGTGSLPSGTYNDFFTCSGGRMEYQGNGDSYEILANLPTVREVTLTGNGNLTIANNDVFICEDFIVNGPNLNAANNSDLTVNGLLDLQAGNFDLGRGNLIAESDFDISGSSVVLSGNKGTLIVQGNLNMGGSSFDLGDLYRKTRIRGNAVKTSGGITGGNTGAALIFDGTSEQFMSGDFIGSGDQIKVLQLNNIEGLTLQSPVEVLDTLFLTSGKITTSASSQLILANSNVDVIPNGGSEFSFVNGPMDWVLNSGSTPIQFPVGKNERFRPLVLTNRSASRTWTVEYFDTLAVVEPLVTSMSPTDPVLIKTVSIQEYWKVNSNSGASTTSRVGLSWGENSAVSDLPGDQSKLVVLGYNTASNSWDSFDGTAHTGSATEGNLLSITPLVFSERFITLGSKDNINPLPVSWLYFDGETKDHSHRLKWATATEINNDYFVLERSINTNDWVEVARVEGAGNSTASLHYSYEDNTAPAGTVYYRLKQVDFDGQFEYAPNIVSLAKRPEPLSSALDFIIYPNPTYNQEVRFLLGEVQSQVVDLIVYDLSGKAIDQDNLWIDDQGVSNAFNCNYKAGIYLISLTSQGKTKTKKLVISN